MTRVTAVILMLLISLSLVSCQPGPGDIDFQNIGFDSNSGIYKNTDDIMDKGPVKGGTLNLFSTIPDTLNPLQTKNYYVSDFLGFIYEGLVRLDKNQKPQPMLSDAWDVSGDGLVWNFHIREGIRWHNGDSLTAEDVEFTVEAILSTKMDSVYKKLLENITTFAAVDSSNFKLVLRKPNSFTAETMTFPIVPRSLAMKVYDTKDFKPVGTGPYKYLGETEKKSVTLERFGTWWYPSVSKEEGRGYLYMDRININLFGSPDDAMNAFQTSDIDAAGVAMEDFSKYDGRTDLIIKNYLSRDFEFLAFNLRNPVLADISVRKAIEAAVDREKIRRDVLYGHGVVADLPVNPDSWLFEGQQAVEKESRRSVDILTEGGWKESDGRFYKSFGGGRKYLELEILVNNNNSRRNMIAGNISDQLNNAGIKTTVKVLPWKDMFKLIDAGKYDLASTGCRITQVPDISLLYSNPYLSSYFPLQEDLVRNISGYSNPMVDNYIGMIFSENDQEKRKGYFSNMKNIIDQDLPYLGLFFLNDAVIYRKSVRGNLAPYTWSKYNDITGWYLPDLQ